MRSCSHFSTTCSSYRMDLPMMTCCGTSGRFCARRRSMVVTEILRRLASHEVGCRRCWVGWVIWKLLSLGREVVLYPNVRKGEAQSSPFCPLVCRLSRWLRYRATRRQPRHAGGGRQVAKVAAVRNDLLYGFCKKINRTTFLLFG